MYRVGLERGDVHLNLSSPGWAKRAWNSFFAPPTVWRSLIQLPLKDTQVKLRKAVSTGEPLNPEVIAQVQKAWGLTIRDGYGQTETGACI